VNREGEKRVVISGGAGGIGRSVALKLVRLGYYPIVLDWDEDACKKTLATLKAAGFESEFLPTELTSEQQVIETFAKILNQNSRVDALVNLAGGTFHKKPIQDLLLAEWQEILDANLKSTFLCCRSVIGAMKKRKAGIIVNTSSNFGFTVILYIRLILQRSTL
jgi:NAD(P)-dependent dehydrogenase (short-subunit alcohol dehydrogenase family)